ncbi:MAG: protein kinase, partial [Candidatus Eisenbacteria bacterium]|nr:protein kinase [Candidatus Eisenbacteria bacterium]
MLRSGQKFDRFEILEKLGEGGMGAVFLAEDQKLGRKVALKILPEDFSSDEERLERFRREAQTAAQITHPNIGAIHDLGEGVDPESKKALHFIVMEYVPGSPLHKYLIEKKPDMSALLRISEKIAAGLAAAHKLGIVHRDIKPDNVVVTEDEEPKILDFGLAKPTEKVIDFGDDSNEDATVTVAGALTQDGKIVGTVDYMSPEQAQGATLDTRSDIFSFGVLLYRITAGETPFSGPTQVSTLAKIIEGTHTALSQRNEATHPELERIVDKCLQKSPQDRYQDTRDLVVDLRQLRKVYDSGITDSGMFATAQKPQSGSAGLGKKLGLGLVGLAAAAAIIVFGMKLGGDGGPTPTAQASEGHLAVLGFENKTGDTELAWMETGLSEILLTDLARCEGLTVISRERVLDELKRTGKSKDPGHRDWLNASRTLGAGTIMTGAYYKLGDQVRIDARVEDAGSGDLVFTETVRGADAFGLVDSLTARVTKQLHVVPDAAPAQSSVSEMMATSAEAYKHYHLGMEDFLVSEFDDARAEFQKALAVDSTFALPYMRTGMSLVFEGKTQAAQGYFAKASLYADKLPPREQSLLDVYLDVWTRQDYGASYNKLELLAEKYPDDKEVLSIFASLVVGFNADTTKGFALFERVLEQDPTFPWAVSFYANTLEQFDQHERAIVLWERLLETYPDYKEGWEKIGDNYLSLGNIDKAMETYQGYTQRFPDDPGVYNDLAGLAIRKRDFKQAREYTEKILSLKPGDERWSRSYLMTKANIDIWEGNFHDSLDLFRKYLSFAEGAQDSTQIFQALATMGVWWYRFEDPDSSVYYHRRSIPYAQPVSQMQPINQISLADPDQAKEMEDELEAAIQNFKDHTPGQLWQLADGTRLFFDGITNRDTTKMLAYFDALTKLPENLQGGGGNKVFYARLLTSQG